MPRYEYKTITLAAKGPGLFKGREVPDLETILNREGGDGWRFREVVPPSEALHGAGVAMVVLERELT